MVVGTEASCLSSVGLWSQDLLRAVFHPGHRPSLGFGGDAHPPFGEMQPLEVWIPRAGCRSRCAVNQVDENQNCQCVSWQLGEQ